MATAQFGLTDQPELLLHPLADRMALLAEQERFEEAAEVRNRAGALAAALDRRNRIDDLRRSGLLRLLVDGTSTAEFHDGRLVDTSPLGNREHDFSLFPHPRLILSIHLTGHYPKSSRTNCTASPRGFGKMLIGSWSTTVTEYWPNQSTGHQPSEPGPITT
ncbi:MAG: hypothetical protein CM1200mP26_24790 [Acidimicrobiales bacterium]|nr:MAG: hypothetical protein CM1200mP26_24790 [Acidimicrobiales bacterium]